MFKRFTKSAELRGIYYDYFNYHDLNKNFSGIIMYLCQNMLIIKFNKTYFKTLNNSKYYV